MPGKNPSKAKKAQGARKPASSATSRAGLIVPVPKVMNLLRRDRLNARVSRQSAVMMAAILEWFAHELFELAGSVALAKKKKRLVNRHFQLAIQGDDQLSKMFAGSIIYQGGVLPHINPALLPKGKKKAQESADQANVGASQEV